MLAFFFNHPPICMHACAVFELIFLLLFLFPDMYALPFFLSLPLL